MPRPRSKKKGVQKPSVSSELKVLHQDMKALLEVTSQDSLRFIPDVPDVPRIRFGANSLYNLEASYISTQNTSTNVPTFGGLAFSLSSITNFGNYTAVFDMFRILQVHVKIHTTGAVSTQQFYTILDYDDANPPTSMDPFLKSKSLKVGFLNQIDERLLSPHIAIAAFAGSVFNGYANLGNRAFIDCASPQCQYYGLKYYSPATPGGVVSINFIVTLMLQFKDQRAT